MTDNGRNHTNRDVVEWAQEAEALGVGEILITSIERDGTGKGFDVDLIGAVAHSVSIPVIAAGGCGKPHDVIDAVSRGNASAAAMGHALHTDKFSFKDVRREMSAADIPVREAHL